MVLRWKEDIAITFISLSLPEKRDRYSTTGSCFLYISLGRLQEASITGQETRLSWAASPFALKITNPTRLMMSCRRFLPCPNAQLCLRRKKKPTPLMFASLSKRQFCKKEVKNCKPQSQIWPTKMINVSPRVLFASFFLSGLRGWLQRAVSRINCSDSLVFSFSFPRIPQALLSHIIRNTSYKLTTGIPH